MIHRLLFFMLHYQGGGVSPKNTFKKKSFSTIPINPVSLASHLTTSETNQVQHNARTKGKSKAILFIKSHT